MAFKIVILTALLPFVAHASLKTLFVSSDRTPHIFKLSFDNTSNFLALTQTTFGHGGAPWMSFNADRTVLYTSERDAWSSYKVDQSKDLTFMNSINLPTCVNRSQEQGSVNRRRRGTVLYVSPHEGSKVYGAGRESCGVVMATTPDGRFDRIVQNVTYHEASQIGGLAMDPLGRFLFAADQGDNGLWVYRVNSANGKLEAGGVLDFPIEDARPKRIVIHPRGGFAYVLLQKLCQVAVFEVVSRGDKQKPFLRYTKTTISLLPNSK
jgi:6-phosphogluconolactonase (cycloisomerase 2 family)